MKKTGRKLQAATLAAAIVLLFGACGRNPAVSDPASAQTTGVGTAQSTDAVQSTGETQDTASTGSTKGTGSATANANKTTTKASATVKPTGSSGAQTDLSWSQVLAKMPASLKGTTLKLVSWNTAKDVPNGEKVMADFTKATNIQVEWETIAYDTYSTEINARVAAKNSPDIIRLKNLNLGLLSVMQPLSNTGYDFNDKAWSKMVMDFYSVNGKSYAANLENTLFQQPKTLLYNQNLVSKYDLEDPYTLWKQKKWTYKKFLEICTTFKEETPSDYLPWTSMNWGDYPNMLGVGLVKYDGGKFVNNATDKKVLQGFQEMARLLETGITNNLSFDRTNFEAGKILFFTESPIGARRTHYYFQSLKANGSLRAVPMPAIEGQTYYQMMAELEAYGIPQGAANAKAVPYFLRYYLDAKNYDENTFFADKTILDVYKSCMKEKNIFMNYDSMVITEDVGIKAYSLYATYVQQKPAQIATFLSRDKTVIDNAVKQANNKLARIK